MNRSDISHAARLATYGAVSTQLALLSDRQLGELVSKSLPMGFGIGGAAVLIDVAGTSVFAKKVPLTDLERQSENFMSTANIFKLPVFCQYGVGLIGSPGFGV